MGGNDMKKDDLIKKICECLTEDSEVITAETELDSLEGWDSVGRLMIVCMISETFNITLSTVAIVNCRTIADIVNLVRDMLEE
jgi:acyl carrier protein